MNQVETLFETLQETMIQDIRRFNVEFNEVLSQKNYNDLLGCLKKFSSADEMEYKRYFLLNTQSFEEFVLEAYYKYIEQDLRTKNIELEYYPGVIFFYINKQIVGMHQCKNAKVVLVSDIYENELGMVRHFLSSAINKLPGEIQERDMWETALQRPGELHDCELFPKISSSDKKSRKEAKKVIKILKKLVKRDLSYVTKSFEDAQKNVDYNEAMIKRLQTKESHYLDALNRAKDKTPIFKEALQASGVHCMEKPKSLQFSNLSVPGMPYDELEEKLGLYKDEL